MTRIVCKAMGKLEILVYVGQERKFSRIIYIFSLFGGDKCKIPMYIFEDIKNVWVIEEMHVHIFKYKISIYTPGPSSAAVCENIIHPPVVNPQQD